MKCLDCVLFAIIYSSHFNVLYKSWLRCKNKSKPYPGGCKIMIYLVNKNNNIIFNSGQQVPLDKTRESVLYHYITIITTHVSCLTRGNNGNTWPREYNTKYFLSITNTFGNWSFFLFIFLDVTIWALEPIQLHGWLMGDVDVNIDLISKCKITSNDHPWLCKSASRTRKKETYSWKKYTRHWGPRTWRSQHCSNKIWTGFYSDTVFVTPREDIWKKNILTSKIF